MLRWHRGLVRGIFKTALSGRIRREPGAIPNVDALQPRVGSPTGLRVAAYLTCDPTTP